MDGRFSNMSGSHIFREYYDCENSPSIEAHRKNQDCNASLVGEGCFRDLREESSHGVIVYSSCRRFCNLPQPIQQTDRLSFDRCDDHCPGMLSFSIVICLATS